MQSLEQLDQFTLTGLDNRNRYMELLEAGKENALKQVGGIYMDLNGLKRCNDCFGHAAGDALICRAADALNDVFPGEACRIGGDEFVVILRRMDNAEAVRRKGTEICRAIGELLPGAELLGSCSAGAVLCGDEECPFSELLEKAATALYRAKHLGKGTCCLWHDEAEKDICL